MSQESDSPPASIVVEPKASKLAQALIFSTFEELLAQKASPRIDGLEPPPIIQENLDLVIGNTKQLSYRDALVVQFAFWLANGATTDIRIRQAGGRSVSKALGTFLATKHIRAVSDSFQNIGKNTEMLARGNLVSFDEVLKWGADVIRTRQEIESAFKYTCAKIAANARPVLAMPALNPGNLTFARVGLLFSALYLMPSGGAYQQFSVAALLYALMEQQGETKYRVETKNLNASDKSSRSAGDIQVLIGGNRLMEAIEVTANDWRQKLAGAAKTIKDNDLSRLTIVASGVESAGDSLFEELALYSDDLSVLEVRSFTLSMVSALTRLGRASALQRLYQLLDRYQPNVEIVNAFVNKLVKFDLTDSLAIKP